MDTTYLPLGRTSPAPLYLTTGGNMSFTANMTGNFTGETTEFYDPSEKSAKQLEFESYTLYKVAYYMAFYYHWVLLAIGAPGNLASIFTILSMPTVSSSKAHVAILATVDTIALVLKLAYSEMSGSAIHLTGPGCATIMFAQQFTSDYANWIVVAMTAERFLAVWFPLRVGRMYTRRKALMVLALLATLTSGVSLVLFWVWTEYHEASYGYWCDIRPEYVDFINYTFYWLSAVYSLILPCFFILLGNTLIILNIVRAGRVQRHLTNSFDQGGRKARDQRQITLMLVVVSVVFLMLNMPNAIFYIVKPTWKDSLEPFSYDEAKYTFTARFIHILSDANHAVNFYLYFLSMSTFRRRFIDAVRCRSRQKRRPAGSSMYRTSQTYMHSDAHSVDTRYDGTSTAGTNVIYSAYGKRGQNHHAKGDNSIHSLKSFSSSCNGNNNRPTSAGFNSNNSSCLTANSEV
ncbi:neuropeptide SIFamide receptor [Aplysia californica]|uniref:Neuropeptide SIFamide receptor n=1 Tax=Aplysia californica TaxID=6500 RepID=A0ABM0JMM4_APLCA|nr:neuropeptide SIFamide receptor [Aplysia californica]